jgi:hypothetical protein
MKWCTEVFLIERPVTEPRADDNYAGGHQTLGEGEAREGN